MEYTVKRLTQAVTLDADWDKAVWQGVEALRVANVLGPALQAPVTAEAKLGYDDSFVYVIFRVEESYVRSVCRNYHDSVCQDSCVEFFFTPGDDVSRGYFNIEINCGGTMLLHHQVRPRADHVAAASGDCDRVEIAHSMEKIVEPAITEPTTWTLEYRVPVDMLETYAAVVRPAPGVHWRANFYKCGNSRPQGHYITWAPINQDRIDFHVPEFFGTIIFE